MGELLGRLKGDRIVVWVQLIKSSLTEVLKIEIAMTESDIEYVVTQKQLPYAITGSCRAAIKLTVGLSA